MIRTLGCLPALIRPPFRCSTVPLQARTRNGTTTATLRVIYPATNLGPGRATQQATAASCIVEQHFRKSPGFVQRQFAPPRGGTCESRLLHDVGSVDAAPATSGRLARSSMDIRCWMVVDRFVDPARCSAVPCTPASRNWSYVGQQQDSMRAATASLLPTRTANRVKRMYVTRVHDSE